MKMAFTMIELVFVILILGILSVVAIPRLNATRDDAKVSSLAQNIMGGAGEIASYAMANGLTLSDLTQMSNGLKSLVQTGDAVNDTENRKVSVPYGSVSACITIQIVQNGNSDILRIIQGPSGDAKCDSLQKMIDTKNYPMVLRGAYVVQ